MILGGRSRDADKGRNGHNHRCTCRKAHDCGANDTWGAYAVACVSRSMGPEPTCFGGSDWVGSLAPGEIVGVFWLKSASISCALFAPDSEGEEAACSRSLTCRGLRLHNPSTSTQTTLSQDTSAARMRPVIPCTACWATELLLPSSVMAGQRPRLT